MNEFEQAEERRKRQREEIKQKRIRQLRRRMTISGCILLCIIIALAAFAVNVAKKKKLAAEQKKQLEQEINAAFRELAEKTNFAFESPEDLEHTVADGISYESPFYLSETGVVFYYAPYEIASYAEGFPEVTIPYSELEMRIELSK